MHFSFEWDHQNQHRKSPKLIWQSYLKYTALTNYVLQEEYKQITELITSRASTFHFGGYKSTTASPCGPLASTLIVWRRWIQTLSYHIHQPATPPPPPHLECFHFLHTRTHRAVSHQSANYNHTYRCHDAINDESIEQDQPDDHQEIEQPKSNLSESNRGTARASVFVHRTTNARIELNPLKNVSND